MVNIFAVLICMVCYWQIVIRHGVFYSGGKDRDMDTQGGGGFIRVLLADGGNVFADTR